MSQVCLTNMNNSYSNPNDKFLDGQARYQILNDTKLPSLLNRGGYSGLRPVQNDPFYQMINDLNCVKPVNPNGKYNQVNKNIRSAPANLPTGTSKWTSYDIGANCSIILQISGNNATITFPDKTVKNATVQSNTITIPNYGIATYYTPYLQWDSGSNWTYCSS